jgi:hypothetical protein
MMKRIAHILSGSLPVILFVALGFGVVVVVPEVLIFAFEAEAREDWPRMLPVALFAPFCWALTIFAFVFGFWSLWQSLRKKEFHTLPFSLALAYPGIRVPFYWIKRIVIEDVPAFGDNPDNIYAVAGLNTLGLGTLWALEGALAAVLLLFILGRLQRAGKGKPEEPTAGDGA